MASFNQRTLCVTVESGDTLSEIAQKYKSYSGNASYKQIAAWNNIPNPNLIYVGQKIYLSENAASSTTSSTKSTGKMVTVTQFGRKADSTDELFISWKFAYSNDVDKYKVAWRYYTNSTYSPWVETEVTDLYHVYTIPKDVIVFKVECRVIPVAKEGKTLTLEWSTTKTYNGGVLPSPPSGLSVKLEGTKLSAEVNKIDPISDVVIFQYEKDGVPAGNGTSVEPKNGLAAYTWSGKLIDLGHVYRVRCCGAIFVGTKKDYGPWSDWSEKFSTIPSPPAKFTEIKADSVGEKLAIKVVWPEIPSATEYYLEYVEGSEEYFKSNPDAVVKKTFTKEQGTTQLITGDIKTETPYYFRVRAHNEVGDSDWSETGTLTIADGPAAPTVWSSSTVVGATDPLIFYWIHNSEDGSYETKAHIIVTVDGAEVVNEDVLKNKADAEKGVTSSYQFKMVDSEGSPRYPHGGTVRWQVQTAGLSGTPGDWSEEREVQIYSQLMLDLRVDGPDGEVLDTDICYLIEHVTDDLYITTTDEVEIREGALVEDLYTVDNVPVRKGVTPEGEEVFYWVDARRLTSFPIKVTATVSPDTPNQTPVTYHIRVVSNGEYETVDDTGSVSTVVEGVEIYSKHFDGIGVNPLTTTISAGDLRLENEASYTLICSVSMSSGLSVESSHAFSVSWEDDGVIPSANVYIDTDNYSATITPYCAYCTSEYRKVNVSRGVYTVTDEVISGASGEPFKDAVTTTGERVYYGTIPDGSTSYYCVVEDSVRINDMLLSVYRREYNGTFTELATGLSSSIDMSISDPHPALDYARYRIVATSQTTGSVAYYDTPGVPVGVKSIVIQWDEPWSEFDLFGQDEIIDPPMSSESMVVLPYNIDVTFGNDVDVSLVKYIGRKHPVAYYGTQMGETATWNTVIPKSDRTTLYALRRLQAWVGDVYVREPSGVGYWANIKVSFGEKHGDLTIPITFNITRVEGGV